MSKSKMIEDLVYIVCRYDDPTFAVREMLKRLKEIDDDDFFAKIPECQTCYNCRAIWVLMLDEILRATD